jgi:prostaglandin-endoperoxide synthase 2
MVEYIPRPLRRLLARLTESWPWLGSAVNSLAINALVNASRHRPHPWSTVHDYVSWTSLTNQRYLARHLPAWYPTAAPPAEECVMRLFERRNGGQRLCEKSTCLFPAFAQYLTDGFLRTRMTSAGEDPQLRRQNTSNHQIDMCPLYGRTAEQTDALRLKSSARGERGRLKSQEIGGEEWAPFLFRDDGSVKQEFHVLDPPLGLHDDVDPEIRARIFAFGGDRGNAVPQVAMMNTLFLREHNRLAGEIERAEPEWDDERVFETARNCVIVLFIKIVVEEYINHISNSPFRFRAEPRVAWDAPWNKPNWVTAEFSLLYRWHSLVPDRMTWSETPYPVEATIFHNRLLLDAGLGRAFEEISSQPAGRLGAFNTAAALLGLEQRAIEQGRLINLAPYAEYRKYVSLPAPARFEDVSRDPEVVKLLRDVYGSVDRVEFYPGLFAEDPIPNSPLPPLIQRMVAVDAFSQALTNPLLSKHVFRCDTFSAPGWKAIRETRLLRDMVRRNAPTSGAAITMTQPGWKYR